MAGEWRVAQLQVVCREIYRYPSFYGMEKFDRGVPVVRGEHLLPDGSISTDWSDYWFVSEEYAERFPKTRLEVDDLVMSVRGSIGTFSRVGPAHKGAQISPNVIRISPDPASVEPRFLYYAVRGSTAGQFILGTSSSSAVPAIRAADIKIAEIPLPPREEQSAIAHILRTLDDKIELNRRMNETLEAMARALFRSWFVDFDPVRAKAESRPGGTGLPKPLADLFPGRLVDSELGEVPEGWEAGTLGDFSSLNPEAWSKETRPAVINYVDLSNTKWGRIEAVAAYGQQDAPSRAQRVLRLRDTIVGTVRPGNGSYAFIFEEGLTGSTGFAVLRPLRIEYAEFVYFAATAAENIEGLSHLADGGAYPAVRPEVVAATQVTRPSGDVLARFSDVTGPLLAKMAENEHESRILVALRDTLLRKLISGELRVKDAEKFIGRAV